MDDASHFVWWPDRGMGHYPVRCDGVYDARYWATYQQYRGSPIADALMRARADLTDKHCGDAPVVDIGIGSGHFIETRKAKTFSYDVNPVAIRWLLDRELWCDPFANDPANVTCWDSLEHMSRPGEFIERVRERVLVSVPIFESREHVLASKHFKPKEHYWYWTHDGLIRWMQRLGFDCLEHNLMECELGREGIGSYVFCRRT